MNHRNEDIQNHLVSLLDQIRTSVITDLCVENEVRLLGKRRKHWRYYVECKKIELKTGGRKMCHKREERRAVHIKDG